VVEGRNRFPDFWRWRKRVVTDEEHPLPAEAGVKLGARGYSSEKQGDSSHLIWWTSVTDPSRTRDWHLTEIETLPRLLLGLEEGAEGWSPDFFVAHHRRGGCGWVVFRLVVVLSTGSCHYTYTR
jgi:hypothetical protein